MLKVFALIGVLLLVSIAEAFLWSLDGNDENFI